MNIMVASDLHGSSQCCERLLQAFEREKAERLLLLGDLLYHGPRNDLPGRGPDAPSAADPGRPARYFRHRGGRGSRGAQRPVRQDRGFLPQRGEIRDRGAGAVYRVMPERCGYVPQHRKRHGYARGTGKDTGMRAAPEKTRVCAAAPERGKEGAYENRSLIGTVHYYEPRRRA